MIAAIGILSGDRIALRRIRSPMRGTDAPPKFEGQWGLILGDLDAAIAIQRGPVDVDTLRRDGANVPHRVLYVVACCHCRTPLLRSDSYSLRPKGLGLDDRSFWFQCIEGFPC